MDPLTVELYEKYEKENKTKLTNWIMSFSDPVGFKQVGFPIRVSSCNDLHRYSDTMHENRMRLYFNNMSGLTQDETRILKEVKKARDKVLQLTNAPNRVYSLAPILSAIHIARLIKNRAQKFSRCTIFEVAAGSGFLTCVLALMGFRVITTDTTQGFYLFENHLYHSLVGDDLMELATGDYENVEAGKIIHMPWWHFFTLFQENRLPSVEIFTSNHALAEMNQFVRNYIISLAKSLLPNDKGEFILEGWGGEIMSQEEDVRLEFRNKGFRFISEWHPSAILTPSKKTQLIDSLIMRKIRNKFNRFAQKTGFYTSNAIIQNIAKKRDVSNYNKFLSLINVDEEKSPDELLFQFISKEH